MVSIIFTIKG